VEGLPAFVTGTGWGAAGATQMGLADIPVPIVSETISGVSEDPVSSKRSSSNSIRGLERSQGSRRAETDRLRLGRDGRRPEPMKRNTDIPASLFLPGRCGRHDGFQQAGRGPGPVFLTRDAKNHRMARAWARTTRLHNSIDNTDRARTADVQRRRRQLYFSARSAKRKITLSAS
jgi:hypothetical protein